MPDYQLQRKDSTTPKKINSQFTISKVLFMHRAMPEIMASQRKMLIRREEDPDRVPDEELAGMMGRHVQRTKAWLATQSHFQVLDVDYNALVADPEPQVRQVNVFLGGFLDEEAMAGVVDPELYRNRSGDSPSLRTGSPGLTDRQAT